jgi:oleandomycin transport system ATP-binding protein
VPVTDEDVFAHVVGRLAAEGIGVNELSLHLPSLDEVFMTLTGHGTTDTQEGEAA